MRTSPSRKSQRRRTPPALLPELPTLGVALGIALGVAVACGGGLAVAVAALAAAAAGSSGGAEAGKATQRPRRGAKEAKAGGEEGCDEMAVLVLDELDQLLGTQRGVKQEVLYSLFEWAALPQSRLVLIGVANALDLTERFLPRLRARNATPSLLCFPPYAADELANILLQRVGQPTPEPTFWFARFTRGCRCR